MASFTLSCLLILQEFDLSNVEITGGDIAFFLWHLLSYFVILSPVLIISIILLTSKEGAGKLRAVGVALLAVYLLTGVEKCAYVLGVPQSVTSNAALAKELREDFKALAFEPFPGSRQTRGTTSYGYPIRTVYALPAGTPPEDVLRHHERIAIKAGLKCWRGARNSMRQMEYLLIYNEDAKLALEVEVHDYDPHRCCVYKIYQKVTKQRSKSYVGSEGKPLTYVEYWVEQHGAHESKPD